MRASRELESGVGGLVRQAWRAGPLGLQNVQRARTGLGQDQVRLRALDDRPVPLNHAAAAWLGGSRCPRRDSNLRYHHERHWQASPRLSTRVARARSTGPADRELVQRQLHGPHVQSAQDWFASKVRTTRVVHCGTLRRRARRPTPSVACQSVWRRPGEIALGRAGERVKLRSALPKRCTRCS
jgi:hypothetical protein